MRNRLLETERAGGKSRNSHAQVVDDEIQQKMGGMLGGMVAMATRHLKKGDKIRLTGLGILQIRARSARMGRNPATGEAIKIKASKKIAFRPAKELKEVV